jgi:prophage antirepressor-like protein
MSKLQVFNNGDYEVKVRENGVTIEFDAENVAKSLGFTQEKNGKLYVRWERVNQYLSEFGFPHVIGKADFIPESYVYMLGMKGENDLAVAFQKFIAFEVLPTIRKNKVYIDPSATDTEIDNAVKFATPQKRRKALLEGTIDGKDSIFGIYDNIKDYIAKHTADEKIKVLEHVERVLCDKRDMYGRDVALIHKVEELLNKVAKDLDKIKNWKNGAEKRELGKENKQLKQLVGQLKPPELEDYYKIDYSPYSENYMYEQLDNGRWVKSKSYRNWLNNFPYEDLPYDTGVDWDRPIKVYLAFVHKSQMDCPNLHKGVIDTIFAHYGYDDYKIENLEIKSKRIGTVNNHRDGKIYFLLTN